MAAAITCETMALLLSGMPKRSRNDCLGIYSDMTHLNALC